MLPHMRLRATFRPPNPAPDGHVSAIAMTCGQGQLQTVLTMYWLCLMPCPGAQDPAP